MNIRHLILRLALFLASSPILALDVDKGVWIYEEEGRAYVSIHPTVAVTQFQPRADSPSLLNVGKRYYDTGIRTWIMENDLSFEHNDRFSKTPGKLIEQESHRVVVGVAWREVEGKETGLELEVTLLQANLLRIRHTITNLSDKPRLLAPWSIAAFAPPGHIGLPLMGGPYRPLVLFKQTDGAALAGNLGRNVFSFDLTAENTAHPWKVGVHFPGGWGYFLRNEWLWISHVAYREGQVYPEGGANLTTYRSKDSANHSPWGELEHVGLSRRCQAGESVSITQTVFLTKIPFAQQDFTTIAAKAAEAMADFENSSNR